jgi:NAD+ kinase
MRKIGIVIKQNHPEKKAVLEKLTCWLRDEQKQVLLLDSFSKKKIPRVDLIIVLGGDGTLLSVARAVASIDVPILAVNLGSLGFLTEVTIEELYSTLTQIFKNDYDTASRAMLQGRIFRGRKQIKNQTVMNDIVVNKGSFARLIHLDVYLDGQFMTGLRGDGIIVSSATGSTAYTLSSGGPIVHPSVDAIVLTPIAPHTLTHRPIVIPVSSEVRISLKSPEPGPTVTFDGQELFPLQTDDIVCIKQSTHRLRLIRSPYRNYYQVLRQKLRWGEGVELP